MAVFQPSESLQTLFDRAPIGLLLETLEGQILYANLAMAQIFGYGEANALLGTDATLFYRDASERVDILEHLKKRDSRVNREVMLITRTGMLRRVLATFTLSEDYLSTTMLDITQGRSYAMPIDRLDHEQLLSLLDGVRDMLESDQIELVYDCITRLLSCTIGSEEYHQLTVELAQLTGRVRMRVRM